MFGKSAHGTKSFQAVDEVIKTYAEQTREKLLQLRIKELSVALMNCSVDSVTAIYNPLSGDGFYSILQTVDENISASDLSVSQNG